MKFFLPVVACSLLNTVFVFSQPAAKNTNEADLLHRAEKILTDIIVHDIFSPPVAARIYVYPNIAAYEVMANSNDGFHSLHNLLNGFPGIDAPAKKISFPLAAVYAFLLTAKKLVFSETVMQDSINSLLKFFRNRKMPDIVYKASLEYGKKAANTILEWVVKDQYAETRNFKRYQLLKQEGKWIPTPPAYMAAVEPYWNKIRPMVIDSAAQFRPAAAESFNKEKGSGFYTQAYEVYETGKELSPEQKDIARFWDCNPFFLNIEGHLNFATKKISPGGHWISIAGILCRKQRAGIMMTSAVYTCLSIALFDAFISCWDEKYRSNVIRPETYINSYIDESWRPLLQTPPFPEYPSGHSVVSAAAATVLTRLFGENVSFTDNSETEFGLPARNFASIIAANKEAAISRLYGGIHYRAAIENGQVQGETIGKLVVLKIVDRIFLK